MIFLALDMKQRKKQYIGLGQSEAGEVCLCKCEHVGSDLKALLQLSQKHLQIWQHYLAPLEGTDHNPCVGKEAIQVSAIKRSYEKKEKNNLRAL